MHEVIGRLRGRAEPRADILDRLRDLMGPRVRLHWVPMTRDGDGAWMLCERTAEPGYRACGAAILARYRAAGKPVPEALWYAAECMQDGDHTVATYTEAQFGTDWMFAELARNEAEAKAMKDAIFSAQRQAEQDAIDLECRNNPEFAAEWMTRNAPEAAEAIDAVTDRMYPRLTGAVSRTVLTQLETTDG